MNLHKLPTPQLQALIASSQAIILQRYQEHQQGILASLEASHGLEGHSSREIHSLLPEPQSQAEFVQNMRSLGYHKRWLYAYPDIQKSIWTKHPVKQPRKGNRKGKPTYDTTKLEQDRAALSKEAEPRIPIRDNSSLLQQSTVPNQDILQLPTGASAAHP